ncbi:hypothetical protein AWZ03_014066 [Drosophila navojoa]|uniref:Uncharacterized protein n=1 Tax=Drosophila navojoa TaxID=7232 RepID=A0A484ATZ4_DRONA|nr:uncharacterized protein LOC115565114 [Drosophila navojoa]TDG39512.1 hypothetical protein AWZ03_014066 [Drosophila navojoa]
MSELALSIIIYTLLGLALTLPLEEPRYNQLGYKHDQLANSTMCNNTVIATTDRLGVPATTPSPAPGPTPQFEYALLGQDSRDQHWYRVSLTPLDNKLGYRAQFATRQPPPYDSKQAHKHDKMITELLYFLDKSEEHNLQKAYGQLLASADYNDEEGKMKPSVDKTVVQMDDDADFKSHLKTDPNQRLIFLAELPGGTTANNQSGNDSSMVNNFVYFIKGLK